MGAPFRMQVIAQPDLYLGLEGVTITDVRETYAEVRCVGRVVTNDRPRCPDCDDDRPPRRQGSTACVVMDTPSRGRRTIIELSVPRYRHRCGATIDGKRPAFLHPSLPATRRLIRYVQGQSFRRPVLDIAREVGLPEPEVRKLTRHLALRLHHHHRFPTPKVLAIDDLHIRKRRYTVVTDGVTGRAIALVEGGAFEEIRDELKRRKLDFNAVECIVSDMGGSNNKVVRQLFVGRQAIHVADKWHILRYVQKALSRVISQEIDRLQKPEKGTPPNVIKHMAAQAATIRAARRQLMGGRVKVPGEKQGKLKLDLIGPVLAFNARISCAFWSKIRLHQFYEAATLPAAILALQRFFRRASDKTIAAEMSQAIAHINEYRKPILNYWLATKPDGSLLKPTTGPTERRNGSIRKIWRSAHGFKNHALFELRALYEPWLLDVDIIVCAEPRCMVVEGPDPQNVRIDLDVVDATEMRCSAHR